MYYIIAGHGTYAAACKASCEMITGEAPDFVPVIFTEDMTKNAVEAQYSLILKERGADDCRAIIADLPGGTPYNAAAQIIAEHRHIKLVAGLCQQLLVFLNTGEELAEALVQTNEILSQQVSIHAGQAESDNQAINKSNEQLSANNLATGVTSGHNGIVNFRLDERLIHGQVATYWTRSLQAERIIVADDGIIKDKIAAEALKAAVPSGVHLSLLSVDNAAKRLNEGRYSGQRVFLLVNKVESISRLLGKGLNVQEVNIGNMGDKEGRKQIKKSVYCTAAEMEELRQISERGVKVFAQMVPNEEKKLFQDFLK